MYMGRGTYLYFYIWIGIYIGMEGWICRGGSVWLVYGRVYVFFLLDHHF